MRVRQAKIEDLDELAEFLTPFFEESIYNGKLTFSEENLKETLKEIIECQNAFFPLVVDKKIVGCAALVLFHSFFKETEAHVEIFYVDSAYRGSKVSRSLLMALDTFCQESKVGLLYSMSGAGLDAKNDGLWLNLHKKFGFENNLGPVMTKFYV